MIIKKNWGWNWEKKIIKLKGKKRRTEKNTKEVELKKKIQWLYKKWTSINFPNCFSTIR